MKKKKQVPDNKMGWPEATIHIVQALAFLGIIYCIASCMSTHPLIGN